MGYPAAIRSASSCPRTANESELLIEDQLPLVRKLAWHVHSRMSSATEIEDLVQIGLIALIEAARAFEDRGFRFSTYASVRIRGAMIDYLRKESGELRSASASRRAIALARKAVQDRTGTAASEVEVAREMGMDLVSFLQLEARSASALEVPLDLAYADHEWAFQDRAPLADELLDEVRAEHDLRDAIGSLSEKEQLVLQFNFRKN